MSEKNILIFVYGTLKTNQPNHYLLEDRENGSAKLICHGKTSECYPLIIATRYNSPYVLKATGIGHQINGEIYSIDEKMLQTLDKLEDHPNLFERQQAAIITYDGSECICWVYFLTKYPDGMIENNILLSNYECTADNPYILPRDRPKSTPKPRDDLGYHYNTRC